MTPALRVRLPWRGPDSAGTGQAGWRRVPKIDLLPSKRGGLTLTRRDWVMVLAAIVAAVAVLYLYKGLSDTGQSVDAAQGALSATKRAFAVVRLDFQSIDKESANIDGEIESLENQISDLSQQHLSVRQAYASFGADRTDWGRALDALFAADTPGMKFNSIVARPGGEMEVHGTATGLDSISRFESNLLSIDAILHLRDYRLTRAATTTAITAFIEAR